MSASDIFKSAAYYYARYRPGYPEGLCRRVAEIFGLDGTGRLLDLGCGAGQLMFPFAPYFAEILGLDPEPEMLAEAKCIAAERGITNVIWAEACAEEIGLEFGTFRLASMGHSFHWMDQDLVLDRLHSIIQPGGGVIVADDIGHVIDPDWRPVVGAIERRYLGERRRAGSGYHVAPAEPYEVYFARSKFRIGEPVRVTDEWVRTTGWIIGNCYSHSSSSPYVLGDKKADFERDLKSELLALNPSGEFRGVTDTQAFVLFRD